MHKNFFIYLSIFLMIVIFLFILGFIFYLHPKKETNIDINNHQPQPTVIIKNPVDLPIYPNENPVYISDEYQQIGTLISLDIENSKILPLFGKRLNKNRWLYYSASETNNQLKIDIEYENKKCKDKHIGCEELYDEDIITIPAYNNQQFKVSKYDYKF